MVYTKLFMSFVSISLVEKLRTMYYNLLPNEFDHNKNNITFKCNLSYNQISKLSVEDKKEIAGDFFHYGSLHHIHLLFYPVKGFLDYHDHSEFKHYSFVLYLDNEGGTEYLVGNNKIFVPSEISKIVYFPSEIKHRVIKTNERLVAAGGFIKKIKTQPYVSYK
jgi:hypothetical protein